MVEADLPMGETYDARKEIPGWDAPGVDDSQWANVPVMPEEEETLTENIEPKPGIHVFDLGQNMVGVVRLRVNVSAGNELVLKHGEMLNDDGTVYTENLRSAKATDRYIAKGGSEEIWQPRFTFHGFRYVEISGLPNNPPRDTVTGAV